MNASQCEAAVRHHGDDSATALQPKRPLPAVLGISALYHDSAAAIVVDGEIVAAAQEERFTRRKHDARLPRHAIEYCLREAGLTAGDLSLVGYYEKPLQKFDRLLETYVANAPRGYRSFAQAMPRWLGEKLFVRRRLRKLLPGYTRRIAFLEHHGSHAASAFFPSPFERAAILTIDGVGEWATASYGVGNGQHVRIEATQAFPNSLGLLYSAFTAFCGFRVNSGEYKLMGLAPYGEPRYVDVIYEKLVTISDDGSLVLDQAYFDYAVGLRTTNARFAKLFGGRSREPESEIRQREMDLAASIQVVTNDAVVAMARHVRERTGESNLVMAGGVALNCVATERLIDEGVFDDVWVQPAAGDAGGALGAALALSYSALDVPRVVNDRSSLLQGGSLFGPEFLDDQISTELAECGIEARPAGSSDDVDRLVAELLDDGNVVGWFQGRMEFGPRALGSRSILGDPRRQNLQRTMNLKIKFRESFRPFAPAVLEEHAGDYFDFGVGGRPTGPHGYMLATVPVAKTRLTPLSDDASGAAGFDRLAVARSAIPAVTHVDNSARVQVVSRQRHPRFWSLIDAFRQQTGCPLVINTSFNVRGEPIVCTPRDAIRCFLATGMDVLAIGSFVVRKDDISNDVKERGRADVEFTASLVLD